MIVIYGETHKKNYADGNAGTAGRNLPHKKNHTRRTTQLETMLQQAKDMERCLTDQCRQLEMELEDWKCRLDDALQLVDSKEAELRRAAAEHVVELERWSGKVEELMTTNAEVVASEARTRQDLSDARETESLLRNNIEELKKELQLQDQSAADVKEELTNQLSALQNRQVHVENSLESKELERAGLEKSYDGVQSVLRQVQEEKSQLLMTLGDLRRDRNDARDEVRTLNETTASLQDKLLSSSNKCSVLEDWLSEINSKNDATELLWRSRLETMETERQQLRNRIVQLEIDVSHTFLLLTSVFSADSISP